MSLHFVVSFEDSAFAFLQAVHPLALIACSTRKVVGPLAMADTILVFSHILLPFLPLVRSFAMHLPQFPLSIIDVSIGEGHFAMPITVAVVESSLINSAIGKDILALSELASKHEASLILIFVGILLNALPILQILLPLSLVVVTVFDVLIYALP